MTSNPLPGCLLWCAMAEPFREKPIHGSLTDVWAYKSGLAGAVRAMTAKSGFNQYGSVLWNGFTLAGRCREIYSNGGRICIE